MKDELMNKLDAELARTPLMKPRSPSLHRPPVRGTDVRGEASSPPSHACLRCSHILSG